MPTPILTVQSNTPSPAPAAKAPAGAGDNFQRTLTQQMERRQSASHHDIQAARKAAPNQQPGAGAKPATPAARAADTTAGQAAADKAGPADQAAPAGQTASAPATDTASAGDAQAAALADGASEQAALAGPVADMLALVASLNPNLAQRAFEAAAPGLPDATGVPDATGGARTLAAGGLFGEAESASIDTAQSAGAHAGLGKTRPEPVTTEPAYQVSAGLDSARPRSAKPERLELAQLAERERAVPLAKESAAIALSTPERAIAAASESVPNAGAVAAPLQQASLQIAQVGSAIPTDKLSGRVGTPGWDQQLGQKIVWMVAGGEQSASLTLNPPDLGPLQVVLSVSNDHADATFTASQPEVRQALEAALPRLREMMSEAGIELGQATVSAGMSNRQDGAGGETGRGFAGARGRAGTADLPGVAKATRAALPGMVDTFA